MQHNMKQEMRLYVVVVLFLIQLRLPHLWYFIKVKIRFLLYQHPDKIMSAILTSNRKGGAVHLQKLCIHHVPYRNTGQLTEVRQFTSAPCSRRSLPASTRPKLAVIIKLLQHFCGREMEGERKGREGGKWGGGGKEGNGEGEGRRGEGGGRRRGEGRGEAGGREEEGEGSGGGGGGKGVCGGEGRGVWRWGGEGGVEGWGGEVRGGEGRLEVGRVV